MIYTYGRASQSEGDVEDNVGHPVVHPIELASTRWRFWYWTAMVLSVVVVALL
eukprot:CAMPEP_0117574854 /NCGR_PEP_ID=MMETSP0784-20121206/61856_1 /TAXON_ID=39447 /ORGANISM="" /LENGTH=52 /DNA_ID=CAMNT_0005373807 /DNA_START=19 /DNA_END=173 /DNA_ORIENTATION=-